MVELTLDSGPQAASAARVALHELEREVGPELLKDVRLMVSELVTNSVRHSGAREQGTEIGLRAWLGEDRLCVEVRDSGPGFEAAAHPGRGDEIGGWGLFIVATLTDRWGVRRDGQESCVWFEIDLRSSRRAGALEAERGAGRRERHHRAGGAADTLRSDTGPAAPVRSARLPLVHA
jgi:anti-sigma regulatory factor (Ser/Thr protein kinase)